jgi:hypothetical protein
VEVHFSEKAEKRQKNQNETKMKKIGDHNPLFDFGMFHAGQFLKYWKKSEPSSN